MDFHSSYQRPRKVLSRQVKNLPQQSNRTLVKPPVWDVAPQYQATSYAQRILIAPNRLSHLPGSVNLRNNPAHSNSQSKQLPSTSYERNNQRILIAPSRLSHLPGLVNLLNNPAHSNSQSKQLPSTSYKRNNTFIEQTSFTHEFSDYSNPVEQERYPFNRRDKNDLRESLQLKGIEQQNWKHKENTDLRRFTLQQEYQDDTKGKRGSGFRDLVSEEAVTEEQWIQRTDDVSSCSRPDMKLDVTALRRLAHDGANTFQWYIVSDAEVLIYHTELVNNIVNADEQCMLLVPQQVMSELRLTKQSANLFVANKSASAWNSIYEHLSAGQAVIGEGPVRFLQDMDNIVVGNTAVKIGTSANSVLRYPHLTFQANAPQTRFIQIMEEALTQVLREEPEYLNADMPPPWTFIEAVKCINNKFSTNRQVILVSTKLLNFLLQNSKEGRINSLMGPDQYVTMYSYGFRLIQVLKSTTCFNDLNTAASILSKIWHDIENTNLDACQYSMLSEPHEEYVSWSTYDDKLNKCHEVSHEEQVQTPTKDCDESVKDSPTNDKNISPNCRKIGSPKVSTTIEGSSNIFSKEISQSVTLNKCNYEPRLLFKFIKNEVHEEKVKKKNDNAYAACVLETEEKFFSEQTKYEDCELNLKSNKDLKLPNSMVSISNDFYVYGENTFMNNNNTKNDLEDDSNIALSFVNSNDHNCDGEKELATDNWPSDKETDIALNYLNNNYNNDVEDNMNETSVIINNHSALIAKASLTKNSGNVCCEERLINNKNLSNKILDEEIDTPPFTNNNGTYQNYVSILDRNNDLLHQHLEQDIPNNSNFIITNCGNTVDKVKNCGKTTHKDVVSIVSYSSSDEVEGNEDDSENHIIKYKDERKDDEKNNLTNDKVINKFISNDVFICRNEVFETPFIGFDVSDLQTVTNDSHEEHLGSNFYNLEDISYTSENYSNIIENDCDIKNIIQPKDDDLEINESLLVELMALYNINEILNENKSYCYKMQKMLMLSNVNSAPRTKYREKILTRINSLKDLEVALYSVYQRETMHENIIENYIKLSTGVQYVASVEGKPIKYRDLIVHYMDQLKTMSEVLSIILEVITN